MSRRGTVPASPTATDRVAEWNGTWALAVAFGLASVPWTYAFVAGLHLPLWPAFVASASFFAVGGGFDGLVRGSLGNLAGIVYAVATLGARRGGGGGDRRDAARGVHRTRGRTGLGTGRVIGRNTWAAAG